MDAHAERRVDDRIAALPLQSISRNQSIRNTACSCTSACKQETDANSGTEQHLPAVEVDADADDVARLPEHAILLSTEVPLVAPLAIERIRVPRVSNAFLRVEGAFERGPAKLLNARRAKRDLVPAACLRVRMPVHDLASGASADGS